MRTLLTSAPSVSNAGERDAAQRRRVLPQHCRLCGPKNEAAPFANCERCLGPLEPTYPSSRVLPDREDIERRAPSLWRYRTWLSFVSAPVHSLDTGFTPLVDAPRLAAKLELGRAWIKHDAVSHPTLSFRDRVVTTAINAAHAASRMRRTETVEFIPETFEQATILGGDEALVIRVTGNGLKTLDVVEGVLPESPVIDAKVR